MADIGIELEMNFCGPQKDILMIKELMMKLISFNDYKYTETGTSIRFYSTLPLSPVENALLGTLKERKTFSGNVLEGNGDLRLAPKLFASLFPNSTFTYEVAEITYSGGTGQNAIKAKYDGQELVVWLCDQLDRYNLDQYGIEVDESMDEDEIILGLIVDMGLAEDFEEAAEKMESLERELFFKLNGSQILKPTRNVEYEKSFFEGNDLMEYLGSPIGSPKK